MPTPISLITTVYNRDFYLPKTLDSILAQTYPHFELLIWDDGSTDRSLEIAHTYAQRDDRIHVMQSPHNQGFPKSVKAAISATTAPYFGWVDSDDLLAPTALAETVAILDSQPQVGLVYTNHLIIDAEGNDRGLGRLCRIPYSKDRLLLDLMVFHFRLIRRSCYDQVGGIDTTIACAEDYDLCLKLSEVTEIHHLPKPLYFYRRHTHNVTNNQVEVIQSTHQAIQNALHRRGLDVNYNLKITASFSLHSKPTNQKPSPLLELEIPLGSLEPLVSIIIPAYNAISRLQQCLQSCLNQTYPNLEIILVDNGSTDDTVQIAQTILQKSNRPFHILHCPQRGANHARNFGLAHAQGDYIQWLDADDDLAPDKLLKQVMALVQHPQCEIAYGNWDWCFWENQKQIAQLRFVDRPYDDFLWETLLDNWRPPHAYLLRRSAALQLMNAQAWQPETTVYMDREYFTIAALIGFQFLYVPDSWVRYHHWSMSQVSRRATYRDRVVNRQRIFQRFQEIAQTSPNPISPTQRSLLAQSWNLWIPAFTLSQINAQTFVLTHPQQSQPLKLTAQEANMAWALSTAPQPRTLEDHTRKVIQVLWLQLLSEDATATQSLDYDAISNQLAWRIGRHPNAALTDNPAIFTHTSHTVQSKQMLHPLLQEVPMFTPLFSGERWHVFQFLNRLCQHGWLQPFIMGSRTQQTISQVG